MTTLEYVLLSLNAGGLIAFAVIQWRIISAYNTVFKSTDIKRLAEYYEKLNQLHKQNALAVAHQEVNTAMQEHYNKIGKQYDEMATFIESLYQGLPEENKKEFIKNHLPSCEGLFPYSEIKDDSSHK